MAQSLHGDQGVEWVLLIDGALDDLQWIHPNVKMTKTSHNWRHRGMIKDMEQAYWTKEEVDGVEFEPVKAIKRVYSYDVGLFIMF